MWITMRREPHAYESLLSVLWRTDDRLNHLPGERLEIFLYRSLGLNDARVGSAARFTDRCSIVGVVLVLVKIVLDRQVRHCVSPP
jgi:hypothetical protein